MTHDSRRPHLILGPWEPYDLDGLPCLIRRDQRGHVGPCVANDGRCPDIAAELAKVDAWCVEVGHTFSEAQS